MSIKRSVDEEDVVPIYNGILPSHKKEQKFAICSNMDQLGGHCAKCNKSDRGRQILYGITYMWTLKNTAN